MTILNFTNTTGGRVRLNVRVNWLLSRPLDTARDRVRKLKTWPLTGVRGSEMNGIASARRLISCRTRDRDRAPNSSGRDQGTRCAGAGEQGREANGVRNVGKAGVLGLENAVFRNRIGAGKDG